MSFPRYPKYKASGVEWLGEVPEHWGINCIKRTTYLKARVGWKGLTSEEFQKSAYSYLVTGTDFRSKFVKWDECYQVDEARYRDDPFIQLQDDDLLITKDGTIGKLAIVSGLDKPACLNSGIFVIRPLRDYSTEFMYWILSSRVFSVFCDLASFGSTINHLYQNVFDRFTFPLPPLSEQTAIAEFLDRETGKIDELVAEQRRLMELLKEKRQAVISHAVTKGLNPYVPMKPSGIKWLGDVPVGWVTCTLKHVVRMQSGESITAESIAETGNYPVYGGNGLRGFTSNFTHNGTYVLIGRQGALCGNINYASERFWASEHAVVATPTKPIDTFWLGEMLRAMNLNQYSIAAAQPGLSVDLVGRLGIPLPPLSEQMAIAAYLKKELAKFDTLTAEAQRAIDLLQERRTALISAAVTGQIDVRGKGNTHQAL